MKRFVVLIGLLTSHLMLSKSIAGEAPAMPPAQVKVVVAQTRTMAPTMEASGNIISLQDAELAAEVTGVVQWITHVGDAVKQDDVIARIDPRNYDIEMQRADARLARLKAELEFREQEVARFKTLASRDSASKARLQEELARQNMLLEDIKEAKAQLRQAQINRQRSEVKAPFSGHIVRRHIDVGEYVMPGTAIARLVGHEQREVSVHAPYSVMPFIKAGDALTVRFDDLSQPLAVRGISPVSDAVSRMIEVRLTVTDARWISGAPVTVLVPKQIAAPAVAIHRDALVLKGGQTFVYRISEDNTAEQLPVSVELIDGHWISVKPELNEGDQFVVRGAERLQPGQPVNVIETL